MKPELDVPIKVQNDNNSKNQSQACLTAFHQEYMKPELDVHILCL